MLPHPQELPVIDKAPLCASERKMLRQRALLLSVALWAFMMVLIWYIGTIAGSGRVAPSQLWALRAFWMASRFALGWLIFLALERVVSRSAVNPLAALVGLVTVFGVLHTILNTVLFAWLAQVEVDSGSIVSASFYWLHFQLAWGILIYTLVMGARAKAEREARSRAQREAQGAQLEALKFQVHPHFLFNTLGAVSSLIGEGRYAKAEEAVRKLAVFLRNGLRRDAHDDVSLTQELADLEVYLAIERIRFEGRFDFTIELDDTVADASIPSFLLQPLLENSVKYAVARSVEPVTIVLRARSEGSWIVIELVDDGPGPGGQTGLGTGERNVRSRLEARFGNDVQFETGGLGDGAGRTNGYRCYLRFPYEAHTA